MFIYRLDEEFIERVILVDFICDSDGKIDWFIDLWDIKLLLELYFF